MVQERSKISGERKCWNLIILSFANLESGSRSVSSVFFGHSRLDYCQENDAISQRDTLKIIVLCKFNA